MFVQIIKKCIIWFVPYRIIMYRRLIWPKSYYGADFDEQRLQSERKKDEVNAPPAKAGGFVNS